MMKPIVAVLIYRSPRGTDEMGARLIKEYMEEIRRLDDELIVMGVLHWNLLDKDNKGKVILDDILETHSLVQNIEVPM